MERWTIYECCYPSMDKEPEWLDTDFVSQEEAEEYIREMQLIEPKLHLYAVRYR